MDKSDIFTAELILIFSLVIDISRYFHCRVWITSDVSIHLTSLNVPLFRNSNAYNSVIYERKHKVWVFIFLVRTLGTMWYQNYLCFQKFLFFSFSPPALNRKMPVYCINKKKIYFLSVNTKYISSRDLKTSKFSLVLRTRENFDVFNSLDEIYLVFTSKK